MELNALAFNPRMHLFSSGTAYDLMLKSSNQSALGELEQLLHQLQWAIYHVQRTYKQSTGKTGKPYVNSDRKVVLVNEGNKAQMESKLEAFANVIMPQ
jgi:methylphosphotriester-DNA--protein-cysteine methyltransferase